MTAELQKNRIELTVHLRHAQVKPPVCAALFTESTRLSINNLKIDGWKQVSAGLDQQEQ